MNSTWSVIQTWFAPYLYKRRRTVRYAFPAVALVGVFLTAAVISSDAVSTIRMEISDTNVRAGQPVSLYVYVDAHVPVNAVDLEIEIPDEHLEVTSIDTGESVITLWTTDPYFEDGTVYFRGGTFRKGFKGDHLIGVIEAVAKESGVANIRVSNVQLLAGDGSGSNVNIDDKDDELAVLIAREDGTVPTVPQGIEGTITIAIVTDIDGDGKVTLEDVSRFMGAWANRNIVYDFNGDSRMTFVDFGIILADSFWQ